MRRINEAVAHPSDGDLIRFLDTELSELEERRTRGHLRQCGECRARADGFAMQAGAVSRYITGLEVAPGDTVARARALAAVRRANAARHHHRPRGFLVRAASVAALLAALVLGVEPVRAWILERFSGLRGGVSTSTASVSAPREESVRRSSLVAFAPHGTSFELQVERTQAVGSLIVQIQPAQRASAQILDAGEETMLVLPSGLRIENGTRSRASYVVTLPADLPLLRVSVGGSTIATMRPDRGSTVTRTFLLQGSEVR